jgi:hypothetical protein
MAIQEDYTQGTVSITTGTKALVGIGTAWEMRNFRSGDLFLKDSYVGVIDVVTDDTHITLVDDWAGPTLSGDTYRMRYMGDADRTAGWIRDLVTLLGNGNVQALANLDILTDTLPYGNGPGALSLTTLTAFARTLLDDTDAATARATLDAPGKGIAGLDTLFLTATSMSAAATTNIGAADGEYVNITGNTAITSFGSTAPAAGNRRTLLFSGTPTLTHSASLILPGNANIVVEAGDVAELRYEGGSNWRCIDYLRRNSPPSRQQSSVTDTTAGREMIVGAFGLGGTGPAASPAGLASDIVVTGQYYGASWSDMPVAGTYTLLVLAQSAGSGRHVQIAWQHGTSDMYYRMSFGGVYGSWIQLNVIRGSNANGEYVRFPDGTQICWGSTAGLAHTANVELTTNINLPISFLATAEMKPLLNYRPVSTQAFTVGKCHASVSSTGIIQVRSQFSFTQSYTIDWYVIGRWK